MKECSNHNGTTIPPLGEGLTGIKPETLKNCPFCGEIPEVRLYDDDGYPLDYETIDDCRVDFTRDDEGNADKAELLEWAKNNLYIGSYGIECTGCKASIVTCDPDEAVKRWNSRVGVIQ